MIPPYPFQGCRLIYEHMCGIFYVVPFTQFHSGTVQAGHAVQPALWFQETLEQLKFFIRRAKMFNHFTANDIVVAVFEQCRMVVEKGIVLHNVKTLFAQKLRDYRPGTGPEIQPRVIRRKISQNGCNDGRNERLVPGIIHIVVMGFIPGLFLFKAWQIPDMTKESLTRTAEEEFSSRNPIPRIAA